MDYWFVLIEVRFPTMMASLGLANFEAFRDYVRSCRIENMDDGRYEAWVDQRNSYLHFDAIN